MVVTYEGAETLREPTVLTGNVLDQAGSIGLLNRLYGLGLPLVLVQWLELRQGARRGASDDV